VLSRDTGALARAWLSIARVTALCCWSNDKCPDNARLTDAKRGDSKACESLTGALIARPPNPRLSRVGVTGMAPWIIPTCWLMLCEFTANV
jgi:hypothetical protein